MARRLHAIGNHTLIWGGGALTLGAAATLLTPTGAPLWLPFAFQILAYSGGAATLTGLGCHTADYIGRGFSFTRDSLFQIEVDYLYRPALKTDLDELNRLGRKLIGDDVLPVETLKKWFDCNNEIFWVVVERRVRLKPSRTVRESIVGCFTLLPLKDDAASTATQKGELTARDFDSNHIAAAGAPPSAIYIAAVCARRGRARRPSTMNFLRAEVQKWLDQEVRLCLARPITRAGLRVATANGFDAINSAESGKLGAMTKREYRAGERL